MVNDEKLKPCPFCGNENIIIDVQGMDKRIICSINKSGCGAEVGWYLSVIELRKAWNKRVKRVKYN